MAQNALVDLFLPQSEKSGGLKGLIFRRKCQSIPLTSTKNRLHPNHCIKTAGRLGHHYKVEVHLRNGELMKLVTSNQQQVQITLAALRKPLV